MIQALKLLWGNSPNVEVGDFQLGTVNYGMSSAL